MTCSVRYLDDSLVIKREYKKRIASICVCLVLAMLLVLSPFATTLHAQSAKSIDALVERAKTEIFSDPTGIMKQAEAIAVKAEQEPDQAEKVRIIATAKWLQAQAKMRLGDLDGALTLAQKAMERLGQSPNPSKLLGDLQLTLGNVYSAKSDVKNALINFQSAFDTYKIAQDARGQAMALQGLGNLYHQANDYVSALKYFEQSEEIYTAEPNLAFVFHNNHGAALIGMKRWPEAEQQYREALVSARKIGSAQYVAMVLMNMAVTQLEQGKLASALKSINEALPLAGSGPVRAHLLVYKAKIAIVQGDKTSAERLVNDATDGLDPKDRTSTYRDVHAFAYQVYIALGETQKAIMHLESMAAIDEISADFKTSASAALMSAKFDFAAKNAQISELKAEQLERDAATQRVLLISITTAGLIILSMLGAGLFVITRSRNAERAAKEGLAVTNIQLEKAMAAKMEFLATTSHEIRTPLNGILGMTQIMLADGKLSATSRDRMSVVHSAGETMKALVDDILDVAKMENGNLSVEVEPVDIRHLLTDAAHIWRVPVEQKGIKFDLDLSGCPDRVEGDPARLRQIIFNLLSNATKFTPQGRIGLKAEALDGETGRRLRIAVSDSGIGIAPEWREKIFDMFQQVDGGTTRTYGGSGLGLAICRRIVEAMDGRIWAESSNGEGSTFIIDLPLVEMAPALAPVSKEMGGSYGRRSILIVEANPLTRGLYKAILADHFDVVAFTASLDEAISYLQKNQVDHILADEAIIGGALPELFALAKKAEASLTLAVEAANDDLPSGVSSQIGKPVTKAELLEAVGR